MYPLHFIISGDIKLPSRVEEAMQMQVEAERKKRAAILESEGTKVADINVAEGKRQSRILASGNYQRFHENFYNLIRLEPFLYRIRDC